MHVQEANLRDWLSLSQKKDLPYSLLILTNMLHFAGSRAEQAEAARLGASASDTPIDFAAAQAVMSSLPSTLANESTLVDKAECTNQDKVESLRKEEALVDEEREVLETRTMADDDDDEERAEGYLEMRAEAQEAERLTREQV